MTKVFQAAVLFSFLLLSSYAGTKAPKPHDVPLPPMPQCGTPPCPLT